MFMHRRFGGAWLLLAVALLVWVAPAGAEPPMGYAGGDVCADCHDDVAEAFQATIHASVPDTWAGSGNACEACHGPGAAHADSGGEKANFDFGPEYSAQEKTDRCLACHANNSTNHKSLASEHLKGGVACSDCHSSHEHGNRDKLLPENRVEMCLGCHQEIAPTTRLHARHRINAHEGIVDCTDCHNPHESSPRSQLGGFKSATCFKCHTDKQGPFIYEHVSVWAEGCTACHDPHGGVNRHMLHYQKVADLCYSCHVNPPSFHARFTADSQCTNCHANIHGSNLGAAFLE
jgi:DmsE family decaheme c-type cytochrome